MSEEQRRLDAESGDLLGLDDAFTEEVEDVVESGRFVAEGDLRALIETFLRQPFLQGKLTEDKATHVHRLRLGENGRRELVSRIQALGRCGQPVRAFARAVEAPGETALTFDQQTAVYRRDLEFVTPVHSAGTGSSQLLGEPRRAIAGRVHRGERPGAHRGYTSSRARCGRRSPSGPTSGSYASQSRRTTERSHRTCPASS